MTGSGRWPMCGPPSPPAERRPRKKRKKKAGKLPGPAPVTWEALAAAVAFTTDARQPSGTFADLLGGSAPESVIRAQALFTRTVIDVLAPEAGTRALRNIGLLALREAPRR